MLRLLLLALLVAPAAHAQWPTTDWVFFNTASGSYETEMDQPGTARAATRAELEGSSRMFEGLGFRAPLVTQHSGKYIANLALRGEICGSSLTKPCDTIAKYVARYHKKSGVFASSGLYLRALLIREGGFYRDGRVVGNSPAERDSNRALLSTPAHEVFHGIQAAYQRIGDDGLGWLSEGTAEAAMQAWMLQNGAPLAFGETYYDIPLTESKVKVEDKDKDYGYDREHFWLMLGRDLGSPSGIAYLHRFFSLPLTDRTGPMAGVAWLDANLTAQGGLAGYFPAFIARHAQTDQFFDGEVSLRPLRGEVVEHAVSRHEPLSAQAFRVTFTRPRDLAQLTVRVPDRPPSARLVVGGVVADGDSAVVSSADVCPPQLGDCEVAVRVVNVADQATETPGIAYTVQAELSGAACDFRLPEDVAALHYELRSTEYVVSAGLVLRFVGAPVDGRRTLSGPVEAEYLQWIPDRGIWDSTTAEVALRCTASGLDVSGITSGLMGERQAEARLSGTGLVLPTRPQPGQRLDDLADRVSISIEGTEGLRADAMVVNRTVVGERRLSVSSQPQLRDLRTWLIEGESSGSMALRSEVFEDEMERNGADLSDETGEQVRGQMRDLFGELNRAMAGGIEATTHRTWYSLDYGLVRIESGGMVLSLSRVYLDE